MASPADDFESSSTREPLKARAMATAEAARLPSLHLEDTTPPQAPQA